MTTQAFLGSQTLITIGNGASPEVFLTLGEVISFGNLGQENDLLEATHLLSTAKEYIYGLPDGFEIPVVCNWVPADPGQARALLAQSTRVTANFKYKFPTPITPSTFSFAALVRRWEIPETTPNTATHLALTLKISGFI